MSDRLLETDGAGEPCGRRGADQSGEGRAGVQLARPRHVSVASSVSPPVELGRGVHRDRLRLLESKAG